MYEFIKFNDYIFYVNGKEDEPIPKISLVVGKGFSVLIDVGNKKEQLIALDNGILKYNLPKIAYIIITHFHDDHIHNLNYFNDAKILCSKYTSKYISKESTIIDRKTTLNIGNLNLIIDTLPNSHAKGSLLIYDDLNKVMFVGDAFGPKILNDKLFINKASTYELIKKINEYEVEAFLDGHSNPRETTKEKVYNLLKDYQSLCKVSANDFIEIKE